MADVVIREDRIAACVNNLACTLWTMPVGFFMYLNTIHVGPVPRDGDPVLTMSFCNKHYKCCYGVYCLLSVCCDRCSCALSFLAEFPGMCVCVCVCVFVCERERERGRNLRCQLGVQRLLGVKR